MKEFIKNNTIVSIIMIPSFLWTITFGIIFLIQSITGNVFSLSPMTIGIGSSVLGVLIGMYIRKIKDEEEINNEWCNIEK